MSQYNIMPDQPPLAQSPDQELLSPDWSDFKFAEPKLKKIIESWKVVSSETERLRALRYIRVDEDSLKAEKIFDEDEMYVAARLIDSNIRSEQPQYIAYLTQSRRAAIFKPPGGAQLDGVDKLEQNFTDVARYMAWEKSFIRVIDGSQHHGWDTVEVVMDVSKPGHFSIEHIGHENLLFNSEAEDIYNQEILLRKIDYTGIQLRQNVQQFGWNLDSVKKLLSDNSEKREADDSGTRKFTVYKCFYKDLAKGGAIYVGWFSPKCDDWLKAPESLFLGVRDIEGGTVIENGVADYPPTPEVEFPFYMLPYAESEDAKITSIFGRAFLDEPAQEAASGMMSAIVNRALRAQNVYASPEPSPVQADSSLPKETDIKLKSGIFLDKPVRFTFMDFAPVSAIQAFQAITTQNRSETAKPDFAVENRKDSRKTAEEIKAVTSEAARLSSVQVTLLSIFIRQVYGRCWRIYKSRVLQKKITVVEELYPLFDIDYEIKSSGDVDVIQRAEKAQRQMQAWPVISKIPALVMPFLKNILRALFPDDAAEYIAALESIDPVQLITMLSEEVKQLAILPDGNINPIAQQRAPQLIQLEQATQQYLINNTGQQQQNTQESEQEPQAA